MGADGWGPSRVPKPAQPVTSGGLLSQIMKNQRQDDRKLSDRTPSSATMETSDDGWHLEFSGGALVSGGTWSTVLDLDAGGWVVAVNAVVDAPFDVPGDFVVCSVDGDEGFGSAVKCFRISSVVGSLGVAVTVTTTIGLGDHTTTITGSATKIYDL